jgi:GAF domain-containing protein
VSQGELIGVLNLGARLSAQDYSADDRSLLNNLATQAAPALRVAQLVRQQQAEVAVRERIEQELRVARLIQQTLLPNRSRRSTAGSLHGATSRRVRSAAISTISSIYRTAPSGW